MPDKWVRVAKCIRYREHPTRKHGVSLDRYYVLRFNFKGEEFNEALGWASEGITLAKAQSELSRIKEAQRTGVGPISLNEKREIAQVQRKEEESRRQQEAKAAITLAAYYEDSYKPWALATKAKAFEREDSLWRNWLLPDLGNLPIRDIRLEHWDKLVQSMKKLGKAERTRQYATGTLRRIINHAVERNIISTIPPSGKAVGSTAPKNNRRTRVLEKYELDLLLTSLEKKDLCIFRITIFAAITGCRFGELASLTWKNTNLTEKKITFLETKNGTARIIPVENGLIEILKGINPGKQNDFVFLNSKNRPFKEVPSSFQDTVESLGLNDGRTKNDRFTFHSLRHGAATAYAQKMTLRDLMDYMGWKVATMALRYMHSNEASQRAALVDFENIVLGGHYPSHHLV